MYESLLVEKLQQKESTWIYQEAHGVGYCQIAIRPRSFVKMNLTGIICVCGLIWFSL